MRHPATPAIHSALLVPESSRAAGPTAVQLQLSVDKNRLCTFTLHSGIDVNLSVWRKSLCGERHHTKRLAGPPLNRPAGRTHMRICAVGFRPHDCAYLGKEVRRRSCRSGPQLCADCGRRSTPRQISGSRWTIPRVPPCPFEAPEVDRIGSSAGIGRCPDTANRGGGHDPTADRCLNATPAFAGPVVRPSQA